MSRLREVFVFRTDEECIEWFQSLTPEEQAEVIKDVTEFIENIKKALKPIYDAFIAGDSNAYSHKRQKHE